MSTVPLDPLDEQLNHQTPRPFRIAGTSDHRFYDRHWLMAISEDSEIGVIAGCALYKNMGVCDGFVCVQVAEQQHNLRFSRPLDDRIEPAVGPLRITVVEPFESIRLTVRDAGIAVDLHWTSLFPATLESPHLELREGRVVRDASRYGQAGTWSGQVTVEGRTFSPERWWGVRDHSWGVRPDVGGFEPDHGRGNQNGRLWLWTYGATAEHSVYFQLIEDGQGNIEYLEGQVHSARGSARVTAVEHDIAFQSGSRIWKALTYRLTTDSGEEFVLQGTPVLSPWAYRGAGYENGFNDSRGVGVPRGLAVERDTLDLTDPTKVMLEGRPWHPGHREQPARITLNGAAGFAHMPVMSTGTVARYSLGVRK